MEANKKMIVGVLVFLCILCLGGIFWTSTTNKKLPGEGEQITKTASTKNVLSKKKGEDASTQDETDTDDGSVDNEEESIIFDIPVNEEPMVDSSEIASNMDFNMPLDTPTTSSSPFGTSRFVYVAVQEDGKDALMHYLSENYQNYDIEKVPEKASFIGRYNQGYVYKIVVSF